MTNMRSWEGDWLTVTVLLSSTQSLTPPKSLFNSLSCSINSIFQTIALMVLLSFPFLTPPSHFSFSRVAKRVNTYTHHLYEFVLMKWRIEKSFFSLPLIRWSHTFAFQPWRWGRKTFASSYTRHRVVNRRSKWILMMMTAGREVMMMMTVDSSVTSWDSKEGTVNSSHGSKDWTKRIQSSSLSVREKMIAILFSCLLWTERGYVLLIRSNWLDLKVCSCVVSGCVNHSEHSAIPLVPVVIMDVGREKKLISWKHWEMNVHLSGHSLNHMGNNRNESRRPFLRRCVLLLGTSVGREI